MAKTKKRKSSAVAASATGRTDGIARKRIDKEGDLDEVSKRLNATLEDIDRDRADHITKLQVKEKELLDRLIKLDDEKVKTAEVHGTVDVSDDDLIEINAGGKIIAAKRGTLTQLPGSRLAALFSGRWDQKLLRDVKSRIFLDVNGDCFQAIVDYLNELAISSRDEEPGLSRVDDELQHILTHQMAVLGLDVESLLDSTIVTRYSNEEILHNWLKEDGSEGALELLYRSSRDDLLASTFHSKCDSKGPTLVIVETTDGGLIGGYTNTSWKSSSKGKGSSKSRYGLYASANKAFLFVLSGFGLSSPCKMKLIDTTGQHGMYNYSSYGPTFGGGHDLQVNGSSLSLNIGYSFERDPSGLLTGSSSYTIKELEVFQVTNKTVSLHSSRKEQIVSKVSSTVKKAVPVERFSREVNDIINEKWTTLHELEVDLLGIEESFKDEAKFVDSFSSDDANDIVKLNVSGTLMTTSRQTLMLCKDSVLAQQFDDSKWTEQGCTDLSRVKDWSPDDVTNWVKSLKGVPDNVATLFWENEIHGSELLALDKEGLKDIGVKRTGTICLLMKEIKILDDASQDSATLIEYSPYCFGKILDYLRLMRLHDAGLIDKPTLPEVCESQKKRFEKIVKYYFPGDSAKFILG